MFVQCGGSLASMALWNVYWKVRQRLERVKDGSGREGFKLNIEMKWKWRGVKKWEMRNRANGCICVSFEHVYS